MVIFNHGYSEQYDNLYANKDYNQECDLIVKILTRFFDKEPIKLLDIGCGTGTHSIELARRGFHVVGVEPSSSMLNLAIVKSQGLLSNRPVWTLGDVCNFNAGENFDVAIMMFAVIGYLTKNDDILSGLRNIRKHLDNGAIFICDFWYGPSVVKNPPTDAVRIVKTKKGKVVRSSQTKLDITSHTAEVSFNLITIENNKVISDTNETHNQRFFFPQEIRLFLELTGFSLLSISPFPTVDDSLTFDTKSAIVVAKAI